MARVFLSLGSNDGHRTANLSKAITLLKSSPCRMIRVSSCYETEPWGCSPQHFFYNQAVELDTSLDPFALLDHLQEIERLCGRLPAGEHYAPRTLDADMLLYDNRVLSAENLKIPHPLLSVRRFVLVPLAEIAPEVMHPLLFKTIHQLLEACTDDRQVVKIR